MKSFHIFALLALFVLIVVYNNRTKEGNANQQKRKGAARVSGGKVTANRPRRRGAARLSSGTNNMYGGGKINSKQV